MLFSLGAFVVTRLGIRAPLYSAPFGCVCLAEVGLAGRPTFGSHLPSSEAAFRDGGNGGVFIGDDLLELEAPELSLAPARSLSYRGHAYRLSGVGRMREKR